jgi:hypothetical protein
MAALLEHRPVGKQTAPRAKTKPPRPSTPRARGGEPPGATRSTRRGARLTASSASPPAPSTAQSATAALHHTPPEAPPVAPASPDVPTPGSSSLADPAVISGLNRQVAVLENNLFASHMLAGLALDGTAGVTSVR